MNLLDPIKFEILEVDPNSQFYVVNTYDFLNQKTGDHIKMDYWTLENDTTVDVIGTLKNIEEKF